jgi:hypothetical protein
LLLGSVRLGSRLLDAVAARIEAEAERMGGFARAIARLSADA